MILKLTETVQVSQGKLVIKLPPRGKRVIYCLIYFIFFAGWLRDSLHFPSAIFYLADVMLVFLLVSRFWGISKGVARSGARLPFYIFCMILTCMFFGVVFNLVNPLLVLWGLRNNARFFAFFFICAVLLDELDVNRILHFIRTMFWMNVALSTVQYFVFGFRDDYLGGFFGTSQGCNAYTNILLCIISAYHIATYIYNKSKLHILLANLAGCMYLATLAELKVFYVEFLIIAAAALLIKQPTMKTVGLILFGMIAIIGGILLLSRYSPDSLRFLFNEEDRTRYLFGNGYTGAGDLNRFTAISQLYERFFSENWLKALFGFGLGSCETSNFNFLQSDFFRQYEYLHYRWFSHAWVYLEQGIVGLVLLVSFFASILACDIRTRCPEHAELRAAAILFTITCFIGIIYNNALEIEACYMIAFFCAIPFSLRKRQEYAKEKRSAALNLSKDSQSSDL